MKQRKFFGEIVDNIFHVVAEVPRKSLDAISNPRGLELFKVKVLETTTNGLIRLTYPVKELAADSTELDSTFHWCCGRMLSTVGGMKDSVSDLIKEADTPQQTLAYNHYDNAREAFKTKQYSLSTEEINKAINGGQTSSGYKEEWRFFQLLGIIHLGFIDCDLALVDLEKALNAFCAASQYVPKDRQFDLAFIHLSAGWASYCMGDFNNAITYTRKAIENNPKLTEAFYQLSKILMSKGEIRESLKYLDIAIEADSFYALKAIGDGDFWKHVDDVTEHLEILAKENFKDYFSKLSNDINVLRGSIIPDELQKKIESFTTEKSLLEISKAAQEWREFKLKPWFYTNEIGDIKVEHDVVVKVVEPYREKVVTREATWFRKEESKLVTKTRIVEKKKRQKYNVKVFRDTFTFFTGKILADYDLVLVEGGTFTMGDVSNTGRSDEKPVRSVTLEAFLICSTQVPQKVWNLVMNNNPSNFEGYNLPVEQISWYDCIEFCNKLSIMAGFTPCYTINKEKTDIKNRNKNDNYKWYITCDWKANGYRLPTEAEWEFAAKGGNNTSFYIYSGSDDVSQVGWLKDNSGYKTQNTGQKQANELGIYDMSGNVWEWCWDWYDNYSQEDQKSPTGPDVGAYRVLRGGSWADSSNYQRSSGRGSESPIGRYSSIGVRLVRSYQPSK